MTTQRHRQTLLRLLVFFFLLRFSFGLAFGSRLLGGCSAVLRGRRQTLWMSNRRWPLLLDLLWRRFLALRGRSHTLLRRRHLPLWRRSGTFRGGLLLWMLHWSRFLFLRRLRCLPLRRRLRMLLRHLPLRRGHGALLGTGG